MPPAGGYPIVYGKDLCGMTRGNAMTNDDAGKAQKAPYVPPTLNKLQRLEEVAAGGLPVVTHAAG
jgi:hypothetical protein